MLDSLWINLEVGVWMFPYSSISALAKASSRPNRDDGRMELLPDDFEDGSLTTETDPFAPLGKLYRMENVKQVLLNLKNEFEVAKQEGSDTPVLGHFIFRGSPGTGKTTVARVMAQILYSLGLLGRNHVEETSGLNLTGEYVGHTKKRVQDVLGAARGGILFIDEAYELGKGHFGDEALTSLVAAMTDPSYQGLVIIIAGYAFEIDVMLNANPGLKSRFQRTVDFEDWNSDDCLKFLKKMCEQENFLLDENLSGLLTDGINKIKNLPGWGNARDCIALWKKILSERANRVVGHFEEQKKIVRPDIEAALSSLIKDRVSVINDETPKPRCVDRVQCLGEEEGRRQQKQETEKNEKIAEAIDATRQENEEMDVDEIFEESVDGSVRDPNVDNEIWVKLEEAKQRAVEEEEKRKQREAEERKRYEDELAAFKEKMQQEKEEKKRLEYEREVQRREKVRRKREEEMKKREQLERKRKERLRQICPCPMGYNWYKCGGGWRCGGGSHFVSDAQLNRNFSVDV